MVDLENDVQIRGKTKSRKIRTVMKKRRGPGNKEKQKKKGEKLRRLETMVKET